MLQLKSNNNINLVDGKDMWGKTMEIKINGIKQQNNI